MEGGNPDKQPMDSETEPTNPHDLVSSDDEIDYSVEPEFYDPQLDDVDELWVNKQRKSQTSDAVLSCPACFTTLCLDCQRHEKYVTQYRAMFVRNCTVKTDQILREEKKRKKPKRKRNTNAGPESGLSEPKEDARGPIYRPVCCSVCSTEVGVLDDEEVYHFFDVIPSNS
ncbi:hypothetical protein LUZ63_001850 [Rhynchospora breviuscula]|uniref:E2F-associated phosphoprotein n=1 Tax=Rhynchospora breviuscula TaxID=2022672 RepID=A0A9Q0HXG4_9POAL|nr:hypothetical protein LUZ63_001850 [Rhynchospora breviuscula]